jgi:drug/metabolite transporter (DMT)-like permease
VENLNIAPRTSPWLPLALLLLVGILLGLNANLVKLAIGAGWQPLAFLLWSVAGGGVLLLGLAIALGDTPGTRGRHFVYYLVSGLVSMALPNALGYGAVPHVGAGFVSLCMAFPPLLTYVLALTLRMEHLRWVRAAGILCGLAGALLLALGKTREGGAEIFWVIAALIGPVFLAIGNIYRSKRWPAGASALSLAPGLLLGGAVLLWPYAVLTGVPLLQAPADVHGWWLLLIQMVVFAATYALYFVLQKIAGPVYLSQVGSVGAIFGAAVAVFVMGEQAGLLMLVAAIAIITGVLLVNRKQQATT